VATWHVAFCDAFDDNSVISVAARALLRPGFRHCYAWRVHPTGHATMVEWLWPGLTVREALPEWREAWGDEARRGVLHVLTMRELSDVDRLPPPVLSCAGVVAALLGIRGCVLTPLGLHREMLRAGAVPWRGC